MRKIIIVFLLLFSLTSCQINKTTFETADYQTLLIGETIENIPTNWQEEDENYYSYTTNSCRVEFELSKSVLTRKAVTCTDINDYTSFYAFTLPTYDEVVTAFTNFAQLPTTFYISLEETVDKINGIIPYGDSYLEYMYSPNQVYLTRDTIPEVKKYFPNNITIPLEINQALEVAPFAWKWINNSLYSFYPDPTVLSVYSSKEIAYAIPLTEQNLLPKEIVHNFIVSATTTTYPNSNITTLQEIQNLPVDGSFSELAKRYPPSEDSIIYIEIEENRHCELLGDEDDLISYTCNPEISAERIHEDPINPQIYLGLSKDTFLSAVGSKNKIAFRQPIYNKNSNGVATSFLFRPESTYWIADTEKIIEVTIKEPNYATIRDSKNGHDYVHAIAVHYYQFDTLNSITDDEFNQLKTTDFLFVSSESLLQQFGNRVYYTNYFNQGEDGETHGYSILYKNTLFTYFFNDSSDQIVVPVLSQISEDLLYLVEK